MWVLMIEAFVALFLLVFIVWWTMPSKRKPAAKPRPANSGERKDQVPPAN
jgi:hypothetical protein